MNQVMLLGRLVRDPLCYEGVTKFTVATKVGYDHQEQKDRVNFVPVTVFNLTADQENYLTKGRQVFLKGTVRQNNFEKHETGEKVYVTEIVVNKGDIVFV